jgi:hypothetical protein
MTILPRRGQKSFDSKKWDEKLITTAKYKKPKKSLNKKFLL